MQMKLFGGAVILGASLLMTACIGPSGPVPRDQFYRLDIAAPATVYSAPALSGTLEVSRMFADGVTVERAIAYSKDNTQVSQYAYHYWVETPISMLQDRLVDHLRVANVASMVVTPEHRTLADYALQGKIRRFEHVRTGTTRVVADIEFSLTNSRDGKVLLLKNYKMEKETEDESVEAAARAMSAAVSELFAALTRDLGSL